MESKAKRTLVKSAPELWEFADDLVRMEAWMSGLVGSAEPISVEVTDRDPERIIAWRTTRPPSQNGEPHEHARIAIELASSGLGTAVSVTAQHSAPDPQAAIAALEQLLDELGSTGRRSVRG